MENCRHSPLDLGPRHTRGSMIKKCSNYNESKLNKVLIHYFFINFTGLLSYQIFNNSHRRFEGSQ